MRAQKSTKVTQAPRRASALGTCHIAGSNNVGSNNDGSNNDGSHLDHKAYLFLKADELEKMAVLNGAFATDCRGRRPAPGSQHQFVSWNCFDGANTSH